MGGYAVLINFTFRNFRSFRDEQAFSMEREARFAGMDKDLDSDVSTVAAIYGANASGKSNFLKAIAAMRDMVVSSYSAGNAVSKIGRSPFRLDDLKSGEPTEFFAEFIASDRLRYQYWFRYDDKRVGTEELRRFNRTAGKESKRSSLLFSKQKEELFFGAAFKGPRAQVKETAKRRPNALVLSACAAAGIEIIQPAYAFFNDGIRYYQADAFSAEEPHIMQELSDNTSFGRSLSELVQYADFGIDSVETEQVDLSAALSPIPDELKYGFTTEKDPAPIVVGLPISRLMFNHRGVDGDVALDASEESRGTRAALAFFSLALSNLSRFSVTVVDEIDTSLHPRLVRELVKLYTDRATNPHHSQLIFSTHDVTLINTSPSDERVVQPDQIWFVEKSPDGSSEIFPATELGLRKEENVGKNYLNGVYGATPNPAFHDVFARIVAERAE